MSNFPLKDAADHLATRGRYGDSMLVHMNPIEVDALSKLSPTGQLTTNPDTGQPEAFLPLLGSMLAPTLLGGTALGAALSPLAASAIGTGIGTIAEGGSLKEGITAGLMGGLTGGLLGKMMPAGATEIAGTEAVTEALPAGVVGPAQTIAAQAAQTIPAATPSTISDLQTAVGSADKGFFGRLTDNLGFTGGATPEQIAADPTMLSSGQAMMGQALPAAASGLVGEMYVPYDMEMPEDDDPYPYEGPYMPTEQRTMMGGFDPMGSAFTGEQDMIGGNVLPDAPNFAGGGMIENLSGLGMAKNMIEDGNFGILPMLYNQSKDKDEEDIVGTPQQQMAYGGLIRMANGGSPAQKQIQESADTLQRRAQDQAIQQQLARTMSEPMIDPRLNRMADPISTPVDPLPAARKQYQQDLARYLNTDMPPLPQEQIDAIAKAYPEQHAKHTKSLNEVMTPNPADIPYQAPSISEIRDIQSGALDRVFGKSETMNQLDENLGQFNRQYNPIVRGIEAIAPYPTKAGLEVYEAIDEFRKRNN